MDDKTKDKIDSILLTAYVAIGLTKLIVAPFVTDRPESVLTVSAFVLILMIIGIAHRMIKPDAVIHQLKGGVFTSLFVGGGAGRCVGHRHSHGRSVW